MWEYVEIRGSYVLRMLNCCIYKGILLLLISTLAHPASCKVHRPVGFRQNFHPYSLQQPRYSSYYPLPQVKTLKTLFDEDTYNAIVAAMALSIIVAASYYLFILNGPTPVVEARDLRPVQAEGRSEEDVFDGWIWDEPMKLIWILSTVENFHRAYSHLEPSCIFKSVCELHYYMPEISFVTDILQTALRSETVRYYLGFPEPASKRTTDVINDFFRSAHVGRDQGSCADEYRSCTHSVLSLLPSANEIK